MEEELERDMTPRLIEDLGLRYPTEASTRRYSYGLYECQYCGKEWEVIKTLVNRHKRQNCGCTLNKKNTSHGMTYSRFYNTWKLMLHRCSNSNNKDYKIYGGRGITVCEEWLDVRNFIAWCDLMHPKLEGITLDRIDNNRNYEPSNCRWVTKSEQVINQRMKITNTSGYSGVIWNKKNSNWIATISVNAKRLHIGSFKTKEEAVQARDNYITQNNLPHKLSTEYKREES